MSLDLEEDDWGTSVCVVGWATQTFKEWNDVSIYQGVGDCSSSYGFDGQHGCILHHNEIVTCGKTFKSHGHHVIGVCADLQNGILMFALNGVWGESSSVHCLDDCVYPAITGANVNISINFGYNRFEYPPPDSSFQPFEYFLAPRRPIRRRRNVIRRRKVKEVKSSAGFHCEDDKCLEQLNLLHNLVH